MPGSHSGLPRSGKSGIHTPQRKDYGFRVRGLKAASRNDKARICSDASEGRP
jgi:hypothetical protein